MIRSAKLRDVKEIHHLISEQAKTGSILPRPVSDLYSQVREFLVRPAEEGEGLLGCGALHIVWEDLAEIRSLAVLPDHQRQGIGSELVHALMELAREMEISKVFVLTDRVIFFERLGFEQMDKGLLPHKIWADCLKCTKFPNCDEVALVRSP